MALAGIGEGAKEAVAALAKKLTSDNPTVRAYAAHALGEIGPAAQSAAPGLIATFTDADPTVRREVRDAVRKLKLPRETALPLFVKMLNSATPAEAAAAVQTLAEAGEAAVPGLIAALDDPDAGYWACLALSEIGPQAAAAVPKLGQLLGHADAEVRMEALVALAAIGSASKSLAPQISNVLNNDTEESVRYAAAYALGMVGDKETALPALVKAMGSDDEFLRVAGAWAYVRLVDTKTPDLDKAIKIVVAGIASRDHRVRDLSTRAFADSDLPEDLLGPAFRQVLEGIEDPSKLMEIVDSLASLGPKVVPGCIKSLEEKRKLRYYAIQVLIQIGPDAAAAVPALTMTLADPDAALRREALFALGAIGPAAAKSTSSIVEKLTDPEQEVRHASCYALGKIGPDAAAALPKLRTAMDSDDEFLRLAAVWASLKIAPRDEAMKKKAVPFLAQGLTDIREHVRVECAYTLGELGAVAKSAIPALKAALADESAAVRTAAAKSLEILQ